MPTVKPPSIDALAVAALTAEGRTQIDIAEILDLSQAAVSRLLKDVRDYIRVERKFLWERIPAIKQQEVRRRISHREISDRIARFAQQNGQSAPTVQVVTVDSTTEVGVQFDTFATSAAMVVRDLLDNVRGRVGVAWGSTLWHTAQALKSILPLHPLQSRPIEFVPLCGDPLIDSQERYADRTSSRIVSELSKAVNGDEPRPAWLGLVPAFIPRTFKPDEIKVIDRLIDLVPQYGRIFGPRIGSGPIPSPIAADLHMIITAAGPAKRPLGFGRNPLLGLSQIQSETLTDHIYGDIGGVLLPRITGQVGKKERDPKPHALVQELTRRWTGLRIEHLKTCSDRAFVEQTKSRPGVTLLCLGATHAEIVVEAVRRGLVNHLIVGSDLEEAISELLSISAGQHENDRGK